MRRTKEEAEQTKNLLLDAALDIFSEKSYDTATLNDIAKRAGVTRGAIYWHFKDKTDILKELTDIYLGDFLKKLINETLSGEENSLKKIENLFLQYFDYFLNNKKRLKYKKIIDIKMAYDDNNSFVQEIFGEIIGKIIKILKEIILYGQVNNEIRQDVSDVFLIGTLINWLINFDRMIVFDKIQFNFLENKEFILTDLLKVLKPL